MKLLCARVWAAITWPHRYYQLRKHHAALTRRLQQREIHKLSQLLTPPGSGVRGIADSPFHSEVMSGYVGPGYSHINVGHVNE